MERTVGGDPKTQQVKKEEGLNNAGKGKETNPKYSPSCDVEAQLGESSRNRPKERQEYKWGPKKITTTSIMKRRGPWEKKRKGGGFRGGWGKLRFVTEEKEK